MRTGRGKAKFREVKRERREETGTGLASYVLMYYREVDQRRFVRASMWANNAHFGRATATHFTLRPLFRTRLHAAAAAALPGVFPASPSAVPGDWHRRVLHSGPRGLKDARVHSWKFATRQVASISRYGGGPTCVPIARVGTRVP